MRGGRGAVEIENETFNTLKTRATTLSTTMAMASSSFRGVCHADDAGIFGGPNPAAVLCLNSKRLGQLGSKRLLWERLRAFIL